MDVAAAAQPELVPLLTPLGWDARNGLCAARRIWVKVWPARAAAPTWRRPPTQFSSARGGGKAWCTKLLCVGASWAAAVQAGRRRDAASMWSAPHSAIACCLWWSWSPLSWAAESRVLCGREAAARIAAARCGWGVPSGMCSDRVPPGTDCGERVCGSARVYFAESGLASGGGRVWESCAYVTSQC